MKYGVGESMNLVLLGAPGAGKGTQAAVLSRELVLPHVSSGDLFREALAKRTELGLLAQSYMEKGELVPDEVVIRMILDRIARPDCGAGFILDGFPRTVDQAKALDEALARQGRMIDKAIYIKVSEEELLKRLSGRFICGSCQTPYNAETNPSAQGNICEKCGGQLYQRPDDNREVADNRLRVYLAQTKPVIDYYAQLGTLAEVNGEQPVTEVTGDLLEAVRI
jgi:adenylate kinase